ncbi:hypothetical protein BASA62_008236 [Batrachochytrium salamandrivorans]|nr:hypothetical protein BASA62_008236 [Batrachochytrium salamandrivorans]
MECHSRIQEVLAVLMIQSNPGMEWHTRIQEVLALLVIQTNPDILNYLNTPQETNHEQPISFKIINISTTRQLLSSPLLPVTGVNLVKRAPNGGEDDEQSDMASQSSSAPTSQDPLTKQEKERMDDFYGILSSELRDLTRETSTQRAKLEEYEELVKKLEEACEGETSTACTKVGAVVDKLKNKIAKLEEQLKTSQEEYQTKLDEQAGIEEAMRLDDNAYFRSRYLQDE